MVDVIEVSTGIPVFTGFSDVGSYSSPAALSNGGTIAIGSGKMKRVFIKGNGTQAVDPVLPDGAAGKSIMLFCTDTAHGVIMHDTANLKLYGGEWEAIDCSLVILDWVTGLNKWVERSRNNVLA